MPAEQQAVAIGRLQETFGDRASFVYEDLNKGGAKLHAHVGTVTALGDPDLASSMLLGKQKADAGLVKMPTKEQADFTFLGTGVPSVLSQFPSAYEQLREGALARAAYLAAANGGDVAGNLETALEDVGGRTAYAFGNNLLLPPKVAGKSEFVERVESVKDEDVIKMGGTPAIAEAIRSGSVNLESSGFGRYWVTVGTERVNSVNGEPFELDYSLIGAP